MFREYSTLNSLGRVDVISRHGTRKEALQAASQCSHSWRLAVGLDRQSEEWRVVRRKLLQRPSALTLTFAIVIAVVSVAVCYFGWADLSEQLNVLWVVIVTHYFRDATEMPEALLRDLHFYSGEEDELFAQFGLDDELLDDND